MVSVEPDETFRRIKLLFGEMDDLCQQRRRTYTDWVTQKIDSDRFAATMRENLARTRDAAGKIESLLSHET